MLAFDPNMQMPAPESPFRLLEDNLGIVLGENNISSQIIDFGSCLVILLHFLKRWILLLVCIEFAMLILDA